MNREQRRQAERMQARTRATRRVQRPLPIPMIVKAANVLGPLEGILDQLERHGTIHVDERGRPIFLAPLENEWFAMVPALQGMVDLFEMWAIRHSRSIDMSALTQLANKLHYSMPITESDISSVRALLPVMRRVAGLLPHAEARDLILQTQIKECLEATS